MNKKIDLSKILKDCPSGMELYSPLCGKCVFDRLNMGTIICKKQNTQEITFTSEGYYMLPVFNDCECMLFPSKDQRDWSKWHRPFVDGDIVTYDDQMAIFKKYINIDDDLAECYVFFDSDLEMDIDGDYYVKDLATEEKAKLFKALKDKGYKWDSETKTLEKLIVPKFKVGDSVQSKIDNNVKFTITNIDNNKFYYGYEKGHEFMIPVKKQDNWELVPIKTTKDMEEKKINQMSLANCDLDEVEIVLGDRFELKIKDNKYYAVRKKLTYPKTYDECCDVLKIPTDERYIDIDVPIGYNKLLLTFTKLLICRDAYWKVYGEELGLSKPWKPENPTKHYLFTIENNGGNIIKNAMTSKWINRILVFPKEEIREDFHENFGDFIEYSKELL